MTGSPQRRSIHPDGQRSERLPVRAAETPSIHDLRQKAAVH